MKQLAPYDEFRAKIESLKKTAETITVTDISQTAEMKIARTTRLSLKDIRVAITHRHKELKAGILEEGRRLDDGKNELLDLIAPLELRLKDQEDFVEKKAAEELRLRVQRRTEQLAQYWNPVVPMPDLGALTVDQFDTLLADAETTHNAKLAAAQKAREEAEAAEAKTALRRERSNELAPLVRFIAVKLDDLGEMTFETYAGILRDAKAAEQAEREEQERQRLENERLKKEAQEREAAAKKEREAAEAEKARLAKIAEEQRQQAAEAARIAREATEKAERELAAKKAQEEAAKKAQEEAAKKAAEAAARKAARAPDRDKLLAFSKKVGALDVPIMATTEGCALTGEINDRINSLCEWIEAQAKTL